MEDNIALETAFLLYHKTTMCFLMKLRQSSETFRRGDRDQTSSLASELAELKDATAVGHLLCGQRSAEGGTV